MGDDGGETFARIGILDVDGVALRAALERQAFHGDAEASVGNGNLDEIAFPHERTAGESGGEGKAHAPTGASKGR